MTIKRVCALVSGGLDSGVLAADLLRRGREVHPVYMREGLSWEDAELHWLRRLLEALSSPALRPLTVLDAPARELWGARHWSLTGRAPARGRPDEEVYLPGRNLLLLSQAGVFCAGRGIGEISMAVLRGNPFRDARPAFRRSMEGCLEAALGTRIKVSFPYEKLSKAQVTRLLPDFPVELTFSCMSPRGRRHCGRCNKCEERENALRAAAGRS